MWFCRCGDNTLASRPTGCHSSCLALHTFSGAASGDRPEISSSSPCCQALEPEAGLAQTAQPGLSKLSIGKVTKGSSSVLELDL